MAEIGDLMPRPHIRADGATIPVIGLFAGWRMDDDRVEASAGRRIVHSAWSAYAPPDPDDPWTRKVDPPVNGFAEFGLPLSSPLATTQDQLRHLAHWRNGLKIPVNSAFLDGTLLRTVRALLDPHEGPDVLTPITLWELTTFIDALVCFDRLYCIASPFVCVGEFNRLLGSEVLSEIPDPPYGMLRGLATEAAKDGLANMAVLAGKANRDDEFGEEVQTVARGWQAVLGADLPGDSPFDIDSLDIDRVDISSRPVSTPSYGPPSIGVTAAAVQRSAVIIDGGDRGVGADGGTGGVHILTAATRIPLTPLDSTARPPLDVRRRLAATATYRTYVNQSVANALAVPYLPGTLRMPFRRLFIRRAAEVQDELVTVALANQIFARQQPSSPLTLPFFTSAVLQQATTRTDIWAQMAHVRERSAPFRRRRAELDALLGRSQVSPDALRIQAAIADEGLKMADLAGVTQQSSSVALGVVAQTGIVPLAAAMKVGIDAAHLAGHDGAWTRIWRRLFHRHEYFLAQTNSQAIALTNAMPQLQRLWDVPKIDGYLDRFAKATQQIGHTLRES